MTFQPQNNMISDATIIIGIDPGVKTGMAVWDKGTKSLMIGTYPIHEAMRQLLRFKELNKKLFVRFEDARLWTYHAKTNNAILQGAGSVKRDCSIWEDFLTDNQISFERVKPNKRLTKINKEQFQKMTGYIGVTSNHGRDAAMLCYGF